MSAVQSYEVRAAFDGIAAQYDDIFTRSIIGRAQRDAVWDIAVRHFNKGDCILELNCGTGEDAFFLATHGTKVFACDVSAAMIRIAKQRQERDAAAGDTHFEVLAIENVALLASCAPFDGVFSNFSGLNCVADLARVAADLAALVRPGARAVLCLSNKYCVWEVLWCLVQGRGRKAVRRWGSEATCARIGDDTVAVRYPSVRQTVQSFAAHFRVVAVHGIGITVPPSYLEPWARRRRNLISRLAAIDRLISRWPLLRASGDHVLLVLERTKP